MKKITITSIFMLLSAVGMEAQTFIHYTTTEQQEWQESKASPTANDPLRQ